MQYIFSRKSDSRIANVRLSVSPSVCLSVCHKFPSASQNRAYQPNLSLSQPISIITICHHAYQPSCPYGLLTYALLLQLISHFGLFLEDGRPQTSWIPKIYPKPSYMVKFWSQFIHWGLRYRAASIFFQRMGILKHHGFLKYIQHLPI